MLYATPPTCTQGAAVSAAEIDLRFSIDSSSTAGGAREQQQQLTPLHVHLEQQPFHQVTPQRLEDVCAALELLRAAAEQVARLREELKQVRCQLCLDGSGESNVFPLYWWYSGAAVQCTMAAVHSSPGSPPSLNDYTSEGSPRILLC